MRIGTTRKYGVHHAGHFRGGPHSEAAHRNQASWLPMAPGCDMSQPANTSSSDRSAESVKIELSDAGAYGNIVSVTKRDPRPPIRCCPHPNSMIVLSTSCSWLSNSVEHEHQVLNKGISMIDLNVCAQVTRKNQCSG